MVLGGGYAEPLLLLFKRMRSWDAGRMRLTGVACTHLILRVLVYSEWSYVFLVTLGGWAFQCIAFSSQHFTMVLELLNKRINDYRHSQTLPYILSTAEWIFAVRLQSVPRDFLISSQHEIFCLAWLHSIFLQFHSITLICHWLIVLKYYCSEIHFLVTLI